MRDDSCAPISEPLKRGGDIEQFEARGRVVHALRQPHHGGDSLPIESPAFSKARRSFASVLP